MLYKVLLTGRQLRMYMEWSARFYNTFHVGDLTMSFNPDVPPYNYDILAGVQYEVDISRDPGSRIRGLRWPDGTEVRDGDIIELATYDYRANTVLLMPGIIFEEDDMPQLMNMDVRGDIGGVRELIGDYIANVMDGVISPVADGHWRIVGNEWDDDLRREAIRLVAEAKLAAVGQNDVRGVSSKSITDAEVKAALAFERDHEE